MAIVFPCIIYFAEEPSGRTAKIGGTGVGVWEVVRDFSRDQGPDRIRAALPQLSQAQITAALMYYARYRDEVQAQIDANAALTPEVIVKQYPGLVGLKVYLDEDLSPTIAELLRQRDLDATGAPEVGNTQLDARAQLAYATQGRAIVTANVVNFIHLAREAVATNTNHGGFVLVPSSFRGDALEDAIFEVLKPYRGGIEGVVLYIRG